jgi:hypothetical protein
MGFHGLLSAFRGKFVVLRGRLNAKGCRSSSPQAALFLISNLSVPNGVKLLRQVLARFLNLFFGGVERCFAGIEGDGWVGGGVGVGFGCFGEASGDRVVVDVALVRCEVFACVNLVVGEASLPDGELGGELVGEASLDEVHDLREGFVARDEDEVDVVGHEDEGVEEIVKAVVLEGFEEQVGVGGELEDAATVVGDGGEEEGALRGGSLRDCHWGSLWVVRAVGILLKASLRQSGDACGVAFCWHA